MPLRSAAFVGVVGGAGTTRTVIELGGALARDGRSALVFDLDFATQGCSRFVDERIDPDATALLGDPDVSLTDAVHDLPVPGTGRLGIVPAHAPISEIAGAASSAAGERVAERLEAASDIFDHVLFDVPPVVSNPAIGGVTAADTVIAVIPSTQRGVDSLPRERGRLADLGRAFDLVLGIGQTDLPPDGDAAISTLPETAPEFRPVTLEGGGSFVERVRGVAETVFDVTLDDPPDSGTGVVETIKRQFP
ncbi:MAG: ParA family protein [Halodesulfurarchaeum sp.]